MKQASFEIPQNFIPNFIDEHDLNKSAHHSNYGLDCDVIVDHTGRASFRFPANRRYFELTDMWNNNEPIPCLDFANEIRKLRARMMSAKTENGQGWKNGHNFNR
jgi:hypothetical protein